MNQKPTVTLDHGRKRPGPLASQRDTPYKAAGPQFIDPQEHFPQQCPTH